MPPPSNTRARFEKIASKSESPGSEESGNRPPFRRCFRCEGDSSLYATHCQHCHEELGGAAQRAYDERFVAAWRKERDAERNAPPPEPAPLPPPPEPVSVQSSPLEEWADRLPSWAQALLPWLPYLIPVPPLLGYLLLGMVSDEIWKPQLTARGHKVIPFYGGLIALVLLSIFYWLPRSIFTGMSYYRGREVNTTGVGCLLGPMKIGAGLLLYILVIKEWSAWL
jgi:hypothetical protein